jgi:N-acetylneuraminate synthase/sialic acid synthase
MEDIQRAYDAIIPINPNFCLLQCTANYPVDAEDMNLKVISTLRERFPDKVIGLSDHQNGIAMAMVAYTLGARVVEKHFTMNRAWRGTDQAFSLEPTGLRHLVRDLRRARVALGDGVKKPIPIEQRSLIKMRKKLVAARDLPAGTQLGENDVALKSPGDGLSPYELYKVLNKITRRDLKEDENIAFEDLLDGAVD